MKSRVKPCVKRRMEVGSSRSRPVWSTLVVTLALHLLMVSPVMVSPARATGGSVTVLNGADPRPFYIIAHNPNTLEEVDAALQVGGVDADPLANALEPDVTVAEGCDGGDILVNYDSSSPNRDGDCDDTHFVDWLAGVHERALEHPELALILFDIKPSAATADRGEEILNDIRQYLNYGPVNLNVILNVAKLGDGGVFDKVLDHLGPREGVNVDGEDDVDDVNKFFFDREYAGNIGYGDGTSFQGLFLPRAIDKAAFRRASIGYPRIVSDVFTLNHDTSMALLHRLGGGRNHPRYVRDDRKRGSCLSTSVGKRGGSTSRNSSGHTR
jgi:hypothetical protein